MEEFDFGVGNLENDRYFSGGGDVNPPLALLLFACLQVVLLLAFLIPDGTTWHWIGYAVGAVLMPSTISTFRSVDRRRQLSNRYLLSKGWVHRLPTPLLIVGVTLAVMHAYFLALEKRLA